jgi:predicted RNA-binding Zn-ribbon protein involved in translation (DUF1610 family)
MSNVVTFFRHCPNCGKRFEIRLLSKTLVEAEDIKENVPVQPYVVGGDPGVFLGVDETEPVTIEIEKFQYAYRCKHCGHQWVEIREEER